MRMLHADAVARTRQERSRTKRRRARVPLRDRLRNDRAMLLLMLPGVAFLVVFFYVPMVGNVIAFQDYQPFIGFRQSPFVGFANFTALVENPDF